MRKESSGSRCDETKPKGKHFNREHDDICAETETDRERERGRENERQNCFACDCESKLGNPKAEETAAAANGSSVGGALTRHTWHLSILIYKIIRLYKYDMFIIAHLCLTLFSSTKEYQSISGPASGVSLKVPSVCHTGERSAGRY